MPECTSCDKPLGSDSINLGYTLCHTCRRCASCGLSVGPKDVEFCESIGLAKPKHPRCLIHSDHESGKNPSTLIALLNWCSSMDNTVTLITDMNFDQKYQFLQSVQSVAANMSILLRKDKKLYEDILRERESQERQDKKQKRKDPVVEAAKHGIKTTSDKVARKKLTARDKAIAALVGLGISQKDAESSVDSRLGGVQ